LTAKQPAVVTPYTTENTKDVGLFWKQTCSINATTSTVIKRVAVSNS